MLVYPFQAPAAAGSPVEVAEGILWFRLPLPFSLDHVNVYLLRDENGWLAVDTGVNDEQVRLGWRQIFDRIGGPRAISRILVTHHHFDHAGAAGWLASETGAGVLVSRPELLAWKDDLAAAAATDMRQAHYSWLGCAPDEARLSARQILDFAGTIGPPPDSVTLVAKGGVICTDRRRWTIALGRGHSPGAVLLHCPEEALLIAGDQILPTISPLIATPVRRPSGNTLGDYLDFLGETERTIPHRTLMLCGHETPFRGLAFRIAELRQHHLQRCRQILDHCSADAPTARSIAGFLFRRTSPDVLPIALGETLSHVNFLMAKGLLRAVGGPDALRLEATADATHRIDAVFDGLSPDRWR